MEQSSNWFSQANSKHAGSLFISPGNKMRHLVPGHSAFSLPVDLPVPVPLRLFLPSLSSFDVSFTGLVFPFFHLRPTLHCDCRTGRTYKCVAKTKDAAATKDVEQAVPCEASQRPCRLSPKSCNGPVCKFSAPDPCDCEDEANPENCVSNYAACVVSYK